MDGNRIIIYKQKKNTFLIWKIGNEQPQNSYGKKRFRQYFNVRLRICSCARKLHARILDLFELQHLIQERYNCYLNIESSLRLMSMFHLANDTFKVQI